MGTSNSKMPNVCNRFVFLKILFNSTFLLSIFILHNFHLNAKYSTQPMYFLRQIGWLSHFPTHSRFLLFGFVCLTIWSIWMAIFFLCPLPPCTVLCRTYCLPSVRFLVRMPVQIFELYAFSGRATIWFRAMQTTQHTHKLFELFFSMNIL